MIGKFIPIEGDESLSYRKEFNVKTMKARGNDGYVGLREDGEDYHVYTKYWKFEPVWNGEGLPPIGLLVELMDDSQSQKWGDVTIKFYGDSFAVWDDHGEECSNSLCHVKVRPIRTEAERKREEVAESLIRFLDSKTDIDNVFRTSDVMGFIDYVAAGKIPGVRLSDD